MSFTIPTKYVTGDIITAAMWNDLPLPLSRKELRLECALEEILAQGIGSLGDIAEHAELSYRMILNRQENGGITAKV